MYLLEQQEDIFGLLKEYYDTERLKPFSNFIYEKYKDINMTTFMCKLYQEASEDMKKLLFVE